MLKLTVVLRSLWLACVVLSVASGAQAADWYLAPNGLDTNNCSEKETPCKNIHPLVARTAFVSGDKILLKTGTYDLLGTTNGWGGTLNKAFEIYGGYNEDYSDRVIDASKTIITDSRTTGNARLFALEAGHQKPVIFDGVQISGFNQQASLTDNGLILSYANGAWLKLNNVVIRDNKMASSAAIAMLTVDDLLEITNSTISGNEATKTYGVIRLNNGARGIIRDTIIDNNKATTDAGGLYAENAVVDLTSVTFYNNQAASAGAIYATGAKARVSCMHCSIVANAATEVIKIASGAKVSMKNSVLANETGTLLNMSGSGSQLLDLGHNAFGLNTVAAGIPGLLHSESYINVEANLSDLFAQDVDYYGGLLRSLKLSSINSSLIDKVPNDTPALLTGTSPSTPFTRIADAHNALKAYEHYKKRTYFFTIDGLTFSTIVDDEGWVLIAAGNKFRSAGAYEEVFNLAQLSDKILDRSVLAKAGFVFDEVRITGKASIGGKSINIDARSSNQNVINAVKNFKMLPNNYTSGAYGLGGWYALAGPEHILSNAPIGDSLSSAPNVGTVEDLNVIIFDTPGKTSGLRWTPGANGHLETYEWPTASAPMRTIDLDLWVRSSDAFCGGIVKTDQRGMPRPDYVNLNDPNQYGDVRDCDIGAFEWNDGYRLDCKDEDGERPENSIVKTEITFCIKDLSQITPKGIIDNMGYFNTTAFWFLLSLVVFRFKKIAQFHTGK